MNNARRLTYKFLTLPFRKRMAISLSLGLIEDGDSAVQDAELFRQVFRRAQERGQVEELYKQVIAAHDNN